MNSSNDAENTFLKADEIDEAPLPPPGLDRDAAADGSGESILDPAGQPPGPPSADQNDSFPPSRPTLRNDKWPTAPAQPPPLVPPPPAPDPDQPTDSLSLMQLKRLVAEMPRVEPTPYTFVYEDYASFEEELEELFGYGAEERDFLIIAQTTFVGMWGEHNGLDEKKAPEAYRNGLIDWRDSNHAVQSAFLGKLSSGLTGDGTQTRLNCLECLVYIALGCWIETAGLEGPKSATQEQASLEDADARTARFEKFAVQISCIEENLRMLNGIISIQSLVDIMQKVCLYELVPSAQGSNGDENDVHATTLDSREEQWATLTIMSIFVNFAVREEAAGNPSLRDTIMKLQPKLMHSMTDLLAELRWDDSNNSPPIKLLSLYWKAIILTFGGVSKIHDIKKALGCLDEDGKSEENEPRITASPLDYHLFRQEITSKYPAFDPPPPLFPFEPESNSILPPLQDFAMRDGVPNKPESSQSGTSILHQPVHIATPAPSPPPSPAGPGGKGIKKQNYQTNQMLPFLYPPLGETSNDLGGKGSTELQDLLVGRKWLGSDIPASILEAADLFAKRMRATRAMKQLWDERVKFVKYERGYGTLESEASGGVEEGAEDDENVGDDSKAEPPDLDEGFKARLNAVEEFYKYVLPHLQSVVIVLLKVLLQMVTTMVTQPSFLSGFQNGTGSQDQGALATAASDGQENANDDTSKSHDSTLSDLDNLRSQEIMGKAVSGTLFLLLKWFKISHILKFEYLTQLLLDSNYIQLILKLFTHQELERVVNFKCERESLNLFSFCLSQSRHMPEAGTDTSPTDDDSVPPPIQLHGTSEEPPATEADTSATSDAPQPLQEQQQPPLAAVPEVDELGYPTANLPTAPITDFSWRAFYSNINHLRILQKIVKSKPHRQLLMVQYKYSNILKKSLKVPQPDMRLYTLKIIKGQVPFCHRKWRQSNMRIITAIYLHCRPSLRDEWLAGIDMDQEMGDALPAEQALRALTYWHNLRRYPVEMGVTGRKGLDAKGDRSESEKEARRRFEEEEQDFFVRELEKMDFAVEQGSGAYADSEERVADEQDDHGEGWHGGAW